MHKIRIGHGYDVHAFEPGDFITLGGVKIPHKQGIKAHSDGDLVVHALADALLGAAGLGDIGQHFPDTDNLYKNISSLVLLREVMEKIAALECAPINLDITIIAQLPKLAPHIKAMQSQLSEVTQLPESAINIKATTTEGLGYIGREEGIAAHAVVLIDSVRK